jgi:hypothetical protein
MTPATLQSVQPPSELEVLALRLEDRGSIVHFAWVFGLTCAAIMGTGVGLKLLHDSIRTPKIAFALLVVGLCCLLIAIVRLAQGMSLYRTELRDYARFVALRAELNLDSPVIPLQLPRA